MPPDIKGMSVLSKIVVLEGLGGVMDQLAVKRMLCFCYELLEVPLYKNFLQEFVFSN